MLHRSGWFVALSLLSFPARAQSGASAQAPGSPSDGAPTTRGEASPSAAASAPAAPPPGAAAPDAAPPGDASPSSPSGQPEDAPQPEPPPPRASPPPPDRLPEASPSLADAATKPGPAPAPLGEPRQLSLELGIGANARLSGAAGYASDHHWGGLYGIGIWLNVAKATALGLELTHVDLGHARAQSGSNLIDADYSSTGAWLGGRFFPFQSEAVRLFVGLRVGLSLEHVTAYGLRRTGSPFDAAQTFDCSGSHGPAFGIGGAAGAVFRLNSRLDLLTRLDAHGEQLTSETVGGCAAGIGSTTNLSLGLGVAYGFDGISG